jgi:hypothetical protein
MCLSATSQNMNALGVILIFEAFRQGHRDALAAESARWRAERAAEVEMRAEGLGPTLTGGWIAERHRRAAREVDADIKASWEFQHLCRLAREMLPPDLRDELNWASRPEKL